jgi:pyridoxal phosphate enzyme (YggS family)
MQFDKAILARILDELKTYDAALVAVSKTKPVEAISEVYEGGQRDFGENYVQEAVEKAAMLPQDIRWHFIGHLQSNKVKLIAPFVSLIHGVDSFALLKEIDKQAKRNNRIIDCLLQVHIAKEETKFGLSYTEAGQLLAHPEFHALQNVCVKGLMGMATLTENRSQLKTEFRGLAAYFQQLQSRVYTAKKLNGKQPHLLLPAEEIKIQHEPGPAQGSDRPVNLKPRILSMGMSSDYKIALAEGSNMVRIGSLIFGNR